MVTQNVKINKNTMINHKNIRSNFLKGIVNNILSRSLPLEEVTKIQTLPEIGRK